MFLIFHYDHIILHPFIISDYKIYKIHERRILRIEGQSAQTRKLNSEKAAGEQQPTGFSKKNHNITAKNLPHYQEPR
jgi:hypothetical protein